MQDADPFPPFDERSEGNAEGQREPSELNMELEQQQEQSEERPGDATASQPGIAEPREGGEAEVVNREVTHSESGEGGSQKGGPPKRTEEVLLKNRRAQRRFRERQKSKITELEDRNGELIREVKRLQQENQNVDSRMAALVRLVHQKNAEIDQLKANAVVPEEEPGASFTDSVALSWSGDQVFSLSPEQVKGLNKEDLVKIWKEYAQQLIMLVDRFDGSHPSLQPPFLDKIQQLTNELMLILLRVSICSPMVARSFTAQCLEDPYKQEEDLESTYQYIVVTLMLTGEQRAELIQLRQLFLNKQAGISKQRADALHYLSQAFKVQPGLAGERAASSAYLKANEAAALAQKALKDEHALKLDFLSTVLKHLISPLQLSRLIILSYPWFPDTLALTTWLAAEAGDPQAMAFFTSAQQSLRPQNTLSAPFCLSISSRGGSGISTPRNAQPPTPALTTSDTIYNAGGMQFAGPPLMTQHSGHSGVQYAADSPRYAVSPDVSAHYGLSSGNSPYTGSPGASPDVRFQQRNTPSPGQSPPVSPLQARHPGLLPMQGSQQQQR